MTNYSFADCLNIAYRVNWRIEEVLGDRRFDPDRRWLPRALSGAGAIACLDDDERRKLTHVEMAAYAHLFAYVEEFVAPKASALARDHQLHDRVAFDALTNFAAEEVKHMNMFRRLRDRIDGQMGFELARLGDETATAAHVLKQSTGAVLLLTACIEWFTQKHYQECFQDDAGLDPFVKHVFRMHWVEECQHAKMDHLETLRAFDAADAAERDRAVDELIGLVAAVDGLLQRQTGHDVDNLSRYLGRAFTAAEREQITAGVLRAKRYTFLETGVTHPRFQELFVAVTDEAQQQRVGEALAGLLGAPAGA
ncbi:MAG TPA: diiron oxygenase [Planctomycetota bacterium]|nr:diiron oxygenase [Planctomycetota bacterium]